MLKVLINEEEVLTNKDFTIKKEMLNTPSVILNNVYPKTWEDTKDYTSNFYHPQDYSKCKIIDETIVPAEPGETITGTSFTIQDNDSTKLVELTELDGNTTQNGTPTPSSPQPINVVSGRQEVNIWQRNWFDHTIAPTNEGDGRVTFSLLDTGIKEIWNGGTSTGGYQWRCFAIMDLTNYVGKTIRFKSNFNASGNNKAQCNIGLCNADGTNRTTKTGTTTSGQTISFIVPELVGEQTYLLLTLYVNAGGSITTNDYVDYTDIMLTIDNEDMTYQPYNKYEINLGKNLFNTLIDKSAGYTSKKNGITQLYNEDGSITLSGTATAQTDLYITNASYGSSNNNFILDYNSSYTLSLVGNTNTNIQILIGYGSSAYNTSSAKTITPNSNISWAFIRIANGTDLTTPLTIYPQLEKGSVATSYSPYKTPIELCKIGDYKDRIYKENGTWYLHKEIGKYIFDGSSDEKWGYLNVYDNNYLYQALGVSLPVGNYSSNYLCSHTLPNSATYSSSTLGSYFNNSVFRMRVPSTIATTRDAFKTWLSTHNTIVYYPLATPTTTEITDSELISQLNAIELLEGLNNVSVSSAYLPGEITIHYNYTEEQTIDDLLFCGVVKNSGNISLNPREPHFQSLQILDFKAFLSEGELDSFVIYQKTILEAIQMVIANIQDYGFILGNINILNPTDVIGAYSTKDKTAYDVFNYIADITQSRWTTRLIDENHVAIDFYDPTLMIEGTPINYTQTFFEDNLIDDMTYSYGSNNYRNKQVMTSSQVYSNISQQQSIVANGYQTQFPTEQPIGKINSITSNGIPLTFATFTEKEMGYVADFYYSPGDNYFESENLRSTGEILIIDYIAIVEGRQIITNPLEIDRISDSTGRKGIISRYEQRNDATTSTELQKIGESYIKYKGTPEIKLKIKTRSNIWEVGQRVQFNAPITELNTEYMIRTKKINYISTIDTIFYEYELISSFNSETEINYFDNQRAKASGNIGEGKYISRNIDIESTANIIFYDTETTEVQVVGDNVLNSALNSPFTS